MNASSGPATTLAFLARPCALHTPAHPSPVPGCYAVVVPVAELEANSIDITYRDYCAHLLIPLNKWVVIFRSRQARQSTDLPSSLLIAACLAACTPCFRGLCAHIACVPIQVPLFRHMPTMATSWHALCSAPPILSRHQAPRPASNTPWPAGNGLHTGSADWRQGACCLAHCDRGRAAPLYLLTPPLPHPFLRLPQASHSPCMVVPTHAILFSIHHGYLPKFLPFRLLVFWYTAIRHRCRKATWYMPWKCEHERHAYEKCQYEE